MPLWGVGGDRGKWQQTNRTSDKRKERRKPLVLTFKLLPGRIIHEKVLGN